MTLVKFDPLRGFESLTRKMSNLVQDFDKGFSVEFGNFAPKIDIAEDDKHIFLHVEAPGIAKEDIKLTINDDNTLVIKGEKKRDIKSEENKESYSYIRLERRFGEFCRSFLLPDNVKKDSISAKFENGLLAIQLEKIEPEPPKEIKVNIE